MGPREASSNLLESVVLDRKGPEESQLSLGKR